MFGEFTEDKVDKEKSSESDVNLGESSESLEMEVVSHLALQSDVVLASQQRGEPDFTLEQRKELALTLLRSKPAQFLYRFGRYLKPHHLYYFRVIEDGDLLSHYVKETETQLNPAKRRTHVRNRRWAAIQAFNSAMDNTSSNSSSHLPRDQKLRLSTSQTDGFVRENKDYFSEREMKRRCPVLYENYIGKHLTEEEKQARKTDFDRADCRLSSVMFDHMDQVEERELKKRQEEIEDDMFEEEEESDEDELMEEESQEEGCKEDESFKKLLKDEFVSTLQSGFLAGKDKTFDYKSVDSNEDFTLMTIEDHDKEEEYFDTEEPEAVFPSSTTSSAPDSPMLPRSCLDRRIRLGNNAEHSNNLMEKDMPGVEMLSLQ